MPGGRACRGPRINVLGASGLKSEAGAYGPPACAFCVQLFNFLEASAGMADAFSLGGADPSSAPPRHFLKPAITYQGLPVQGGH